LDSWFALNGLSLNPDKLEAIVIGTSAQQKTEGIVNAVTLGTDSISVPENVRSLGVTTNSTLLFNTHVNEVYNAVRHHAKSITTCLKGIVKDDAIQVAVSIASARLNY